MGDGPTQVLTWSLRPSETTVVTPSVETGVLSVVAAGICVDGQSKKMEKEEEKKKVKGI